MQSTGVIEFDADGAYYGGPSGTDLTQTYTYNGAYSLQTVPAGPAMGSSLFQLRYSCGDGCAGSSTFSLQFESGCAVAILDEQVSECTGNRVVLAGMVVLTRQ